MSRSQETTIHEMPPRVPRRPTDVRFDVINTSDDRAWTLVLSQVAQHDFHHLAGYHRLAEHNGDGTAHLFAYRDADHVIALPLLIRPVDEADPDGLQDATSVYGYAGPVASSRGVPSSVIHAFHAAVREEMEQRRVVTVFSRLHPLIEQDYLLAGLGMTCPSGLTVSVDLTIPEEEQWSAYNRDLRRLIRRGREAGVECVHDQGLVHLREWSAIYGETMERIGASHSYRFDAEYFRRMADELGATLHLFMAFVHERPAAGGLFTICNGIVEAHLGGSREEFSAYSPVRIIDDTARRWAAEIGARVFHLGGGVGGRQDSLFQYKASFSGRRHEFATWQWIVSKDAYDHLCRRHRAEVPGHAGGRVATDDFFPAYRKPV